MASDGNCNGNCPRCEIERFSYVNYIVLRLWHLQVACVVQPRFHASTSSTEVEYDQSEWYTSVAKSV